MLGPRRPPLLLLLELLPPPRPLPDRLDWLAPLPLLDDGLLVATNL